MLRFGTLKTYSIKRDIPLIDIPLSGFDCKSKPGKLENEYCFLVKEFIGLKYKLYSTAYGDTVRKKAKGIKKVL